MQAPEQGTEDRPRAPRPERPVVLEKASDEHALAEELGHGLRMRATLSRKARSLERSKDRRILLHADERARRRKDSCYPTRPVPMIDPKHAAVERRHLGQVDAVATLQMPPQTVHAQWFEHPSRTIPPAPVASD